MCEMSVNYNSPTIFLYGEFQTLTTLILKTLTCFSYIIDLLISYKNTTDLCIKTFYEQLATIQGFLKDLSLKVNNYDKPSHYQIMKLKQTMALTR